MLAVSLSIDQATLVTMLQKQIQTGETIAIPFGMAARLDMVSKNPDLQPHLLVDYSQLNYDQSAYFAWDDDNRAILNQAFHVSSNAMETPLTTYTAIGGPVADLRLRRGIEMDLDRCVDVESDIAEKCKFMTALISRLSIYAPVRIDGRSAGSPGDAIFLVHGQAHKIREDVRRFLAEATGRRIIVLDDQANQGKDILGKLMDNAQEAAFAVILLTGDDEGRRAGSIEIRRRARQNVILELGLFLGILGRARVAALYEPGVEIPSDFAGVLYTVLDDGGWKIKVARELRAGGIDVDMNRLL